MAKGWLRGGSGVAQGWLRGGAGVAQGWRRGGAGVAQGWLSIHWSRKVISTVVLNREKDIFYQLAFYNIQLNSSKL